MACRASAEEVTDGTITTERCHSPTGAQNTRKTSDQWVNERQTSTTRLTGHDLPCLGAANSRVDRHREIELVSVKSIVRIREVLRLVAHIRWGMPPRSISTSDQYGCTVRFNSLARPTQARPIHARHAPV
jgi:hypothetical protein